MSHYLSVVVIVVVALCASKTLQLLVRNRLSHLQPNVQSILNIIIWTTTLIVISISLLNAFGLSAAVNLTSIGILTLTLLFQGFAQSIIFGIIVLIEGHYQVGDCISVAGVTGIVRATGIRTTTLEDSDHTITYVPNALVYEGTVSQRITHGNTTTKRDGVAS